MPVLQPRGGHFGLILPLCTSSATVGLALYQYTVFLPWLQAQPSIAGKALSLYWDPHIKQAGGLVAAVAATSAFSGFVSARWLQTHATLETTDVSKWYTIGAAFAAGHVLCMPFVVGPIKRIIDAGHASTKSDEDADKANREEMKKWFTMHTLRTLLLDLPALLCFAEGAALSFWVI